MSLEELKRSRVAARGWLKRASVNIDKVLADEGDVIELENALREFDSRLDKLDAIQERIEMSLTEEEILDDIGRAAEVREEAMESRLRCQRTLRQRAEAQAPANSDHDEAASTSSQCVQLPKLVLPKYGGDVLEWSSFWDQFSAAVDCSDLPEVSKFVYLRSLLFGEAKKAIEGLAVVQGNYPTACQLLKDRFAKPSQIIFAHVNQLLQLGLKDGDNLNAVQDALLLHVRSLERLGIGGETYGVILTPLILSRLPDSFRMEWARNSADKESDLNHLLSCLKAEIERKDRSTVLGAQTELCAPELRRQGRAGGAGGGGDGRHLRSSQRSSQRAPAPAGSARDDRPGHTTARWDSARGAQVPSGAALQSASPADRCGFCSGAHEAAKCSSFLSLDVSARQQRVRESGLCFVCLRGGHRARYCLQKCAHCKCKHHILCCYKHVIDSGGNKGDASSHAADQGQGAEGGHTGGGGSVGASLSCVPPRQCSVLPTARVLVKGRKGEVEATVVFDTGSDRSYVSQALVEKVGPQWIGSERTTYCVFGGKSSTCDRNVYKAEMTGANSARPGLFSLTAIEVPVICAPLQRPQVCSEALRCFAGVDLADGRFGSDHRLTVDLLVGLDQYWQLVRDGMIRTPTGLVAQETVFGWIVSGSVTGKVAALTTSCQLLLLNDLPDQTFRDLWDLEIIGVQHDDDASLDPVLKDFNDSVCKKEGRYEVALPWKKELPELRNNRGSAEARLSGLMRKLEGDAQLKESYDSVLQDWENSGVIEEVPVAEGSGAFSDDAFYMPHRPVVRPGSASTKVRPVFDASACGPNGVSLNDCLETGPSLIPNQTDVLLRFRRHRYAVTGDISKAFLQISVREQDRDFLRFLWELNGRVRQMRFCRVPFGAKSSPFLLNATVKHHLSQYPQSKVVAELQSNLYVDDWLTGADTELEASEMFLEGKAILSEAGMELSKCHSNSTLVLDSASSPREDREESLKVLGVGWDPDKDVLRYDGVSLPSDIVPTKRVVLSLLARVFDPVGFLVPFVMVLRVLFQQLWLLGLDWDDPIPCEHADVFQRWLTGVPQLQQLSIPRCYTVTGVTWSQMTGLEIHVFGDASTKGYGSVVYLRFELPSGAFAVSFVLARARVAPVKPVTLPRLELMGCLISARLVGHARRALVLSDEVPVFCWTDSTVALAWVQSSPLKWKPFVRNRVAEIQSLTNPSDWHHTRGVDNPSDAASRGLFAEELLSSELWTRGPEWLRSPFERPADCGLFVTSEELAEDEPPEETTGVLIAPSEPATPLVDAERCGSFGKMVRVMAWVRRFIRNCRSQARERQTELSADELDDARTDLLRDVQRVAFREELRALKGDRPVPKSSPIHQLTPVLGDDGLIRIRGRLQMSELSYESKHPVVLPKGRVSELLVREQHRLMSHAGVSTLITAVRSSFWIVGLRCLAKRVKRSCVSCQRQDAPSCNEAAAPLPEDRATRAPPFSVTGVDHAGPVFCVDFPGKKFYITLFTCAVTRAIHVELADSLSQEQFMLAFRRFAARRGMPSVMYSDNARTFLSAGELLQNCYGHLAPRWKRIVPRSPWWGGWWERLIRSVKSGLRKSLGTRALTRSELETVLFDVEACVNSRPLTFVGDGVDCENPLTPSHFLIGRGAGVQARVLEDPDAVTAKLLPERSRVCERRLNRFWSVWTTEYLRNLPPSVRKFSPRGRLEIGSVVLVREDNTPRMKWVTGVVTKLYPGRDGTVRSAEVRTSRGLRNRAIQRLHDLELGPDPSSV